MQQDRVAGSDAASVYESAILASEIANPKRVIVERLPMMAAYEFAVRPHVTVLLAADDEVRLIDFNRLSAEESARNFYSCQDGQRCRPSFTGCI